MPLAFNTVRVQVFTAQKQQQRVGELNFVALAGGGLLDATKNFGRQNVPSGNRQVGGRAPNGGFFHQRFQFQNRVADFPATHNPVPVYFVGGHGFHGNDRATVRFKRIH